MRRRSSCATYCCHLNCQMTGASCLWNASTIMQSNITSSYPSIHCVVKTLSGHLMTVPFNFGLWRGEGRLSKTAPTFAEQFDGRIIGDMNQVLLALDCWVLESLTGFCLFATPPDTRTQTDWLHHPWFSIGLYISFYYPSHTKLMEQPPINSFFYPNVNTIHLVKNYRT